MPVGFQAINTGNIVQVDADFRNQQLIASGTLTGSAGAVRTVAITGNDPTIFISADAINNTALLTDRRQSGSTFTFYFRCWGTVRYFIFDHAPAPTGNYGIQVFNASSQLVFNSNTAFLRVQGIRQLEAEAVSNETVNIPGKRIATMASAWAQQSISDEINPGDFIINIWRQYAVGFNGGYWVYNDTSSYASGSPMDTAWGASMLFIDITNFPLTL